MKDANYTWGSNSTKCKQGNMFYSMNIYGLNTADATNFKNAASGFLHYMHGINPLGIVYLTNMSVAGAEYSVREIYHTWFREGSALWDRVGTSTYGPPPGFVPGGPNPSYNWDGCCPGGCRSAANNALCVTLTPPRNQPVQKSFLEFNNNWPVNSWSVTENGIYYNASYIRLLSKFVGTSCSVPLIITETQNQVPIKTVIQPVFNLYPNPSSGNVTVEILDEEMNDFEVRIDDNLGKQLYSKTFKSNDFGSNLIELNTQDLTNGVYQIIVQFPNRQMVQKFVRL